MILNGITNACVGTSEVKQILLGTYVIWQNGQPVVVYEVMCSGTISEYTGHAPSVWCYSTMKWYMRTVGGNYREYGIYAIGKPQDPYIGELASDNGHEWEYTASGWVDLGELTSRLPVGYTEVDYIDNVQTASSTTGAVIATDYTPYADTKIEYKMQNLSNGQQHPRFFGCGEWNGSNGYQMDYEFYNSNPTLHICFLGVAGWTTNNNIVDDLQPHEYVWDKNNFYYEGTLACTSTYNASLVSAGNMYIFNCQNSNTTNLWMKGRMFYFRVYDDNVLVRDYVPCRRESDGKVGVYDVVNDTFLLSCNNYLFYAGPDTQGQSYPVEYDFKGEPDIEGMDYKVMITGSIEDYTGSEGKVYVIPEEKWYIRTIGGNYTEYGLYATGKPQDPYIGELATDNGHEWEYTASGWVDLGEYSESYTKYEYVQGNGSSYIRTDYIVKSIDTACEIDIEGRKASSATVSTGEAHFFGSYMDTNGTFARFKLLYPGNGSLGSGGIRFDYLNGTYHNRDSSIISRGVLRFDKTGGYINGTKLVTFNYGSNDFSSNLAPLFIFMTSQYTNNGVQTQSGGKIYNGKIYGLKIYEGETLVREYVPAIKDGVVGMYETKQGVMFGSYTSTPFTVGGSSEEIGNRPKDYPVMLAPEPIDTIYATAADEYLKSNDNYYKKDYIDNLYQCGAYEETSEYVQGDQLTPIYVQGQPDDFIVYEGGRYYKNYIYVQPVDQQLATGDYVRGEYIGPADVLVSGLTNSSTAFNVKIDNVDTTANITGRDGNLYTWVVYGDLSKSVSVRNFAVNNTNLVTCHFLVSGITDTYGCFSNCYNLKEVSFVRGITSFGQWTFCSCRNLTSVNIPSSVTSIGQEAFKDCWKVTSIIIPDSVTTIGISAFEKCKSLTSLNIPSSVTSIANDGPNGWQIVTGCSKLTSLTVDANNPVYDSRDNCNAIIHTATNVLWMGSNTTVIPNTVTRIAQGAFTKNGIIESMTIPNSVTSLGQYAFFSCVNLKTITIPSSVTSIDDDCFRNDVNTVFHFEATTPPTLNGSSVFQYGYGVIYVPVGYGATYKAASGWSSYASRIYEEGETFSTAVKGTALNNGNSINLYFNGSTTRYYANVTGHNQDGTCNFICEPPANVTGIGSNDVNSAYSPNIKTIDFSILPSTCTSVTSYALKSNSNLMSVILPSSITSIGVSAFEKCTSLQSLTIPSGVTSIGSSAFSNCTSLQSLTIPSGVTSIAQYAFEKCTNTVFHIQATTPPTLGNNAFKSTYGVIYVPVGTAETYKAAHNWSSYADRIYEEGETFSTASIKGTAVNDGNTVNLYFNNTTAKYNANAISYNQDGTFNFICEPPAGVTRIGSGYNRASYASTIRTIDFSGMPNTCTSVTNYAFYNCENITNIILPNSITSIGRSGIYGCTNLLSLNIPSGVTGIDQYALTLNTFTQIHMQGTTPPTLGTNAFNRTYGIIYVPVGYGATYKSASGWSTYASQICEEGGTLSFDITGTTENGFGNDLYLYYKTTGNTTVLVTPIFYEYGKFGFVLTQPMVTLAYNKSNNIGTGTVIDLSNCTDLTSLDTYVVRGSKGCKIICPNTITYVGWEAFEYTNATVVLPCTTPPGIQNTFAFVGGSIFYVPDESISAYREYAAWNYLYENNYLKPLSQLPS